MTTPEPLPPARLVARCDPAILGGRGTAELEPLSDGLGQVRAVEALRFGIGMTREGYNPFALGSTGSGKHTLVRRYIEAEARTKGAPPSDWCDVDNFDEPHKPRVPRLPAGRGRPLAQDMARLVDDVQAAIANAFQSEDYQARRRSIEEGLSER